MSRQRARATVGSTGPNAERTITESAGARSGRPRRQSCDCREGRTQEPTALSVLGAQLGRYCPQIRKHSIRHPRHFPRLDKHTIRPQPQAMRPNNTLHSPQTRKHTLRRIAQQYGTSETQHINFANSFCIMFANTNPREKSSHLP